MAHHRRLALMAPYTLAQMKLIPMPLIPTVRRNGFFRYVGFLGGRLALMARYTINQRRSIPMVRGNGEFETDIKIAAIGADGTLYGVSPDVGTVYALNPDGTQKWVFQITVACCNVLSELAIGSDGTIYVGARLSGEEVLRGKSCASIPTYAEMGFSDRGRCSNHRRSALMARYTFPQPFVGVFTHSLLRFMRFNPDGTLKWAFHPLDGVGGTSPSIGVDGTIYVGSGDGNVYAINPNGTQKWSFPIGVSANSSPAIGADGTIYVGSSDGNVYAINPDVTQKWVFSTGRHLLSPAIGPDGTLYVNSGSQDSEADVLYAINTSSGGLANSAWPMFNHDVRHTGFVGGGPVNVNNRLQLHADELVTRYDLDARSQWAGRNVRH